MKIVINNVDTGKTGTICAGGENSPLDDINFSHTEEVQEVAFPRAKEIKLFARGNGRFDQTFSVLYKRTSLASAENFIFDLRRTFPLFGRIAFTSESATGNAQTWYLHNAAAQIVSGRHIGSAVLLTWRIRGGLPTGSSTPPP